MWLRVCTLFSVVVISTSEATCPCANNNSAIGDNDAKKSSRPFWTDSDESSDTEQILATLGQTERQLMSSNSHLAEVVRQAADEIQRLQNELASCKHNQNCPGKPKTTANVPTSPTSPSVNFSMTFCDFESISNCGYTQTLDNATIKWNRGAGRASSSSGPYDDHTVGTPAGTYMYIDPRKAAIYFKRLSTAFMESPVLDPAHHYCIKFWYNMRGSDTQDLKVYVKILSGSGLGYPVWSRSGEQGSNWILGQINLDSEYTSRQFSLVFEATTQGYYEHVFASHPRYHDIQGYISIDDIYTFTAKCKDLPTCPEGAHFRRGANNSSCYTFHTQATYWKDGHVTCKKENPSSHLISINSKEEQDFIVGVITTDAGLKAAGESGFYTSGSDLETEGDFRWTGQGNSYGLTYTNWYPGQPNDVGGHQDCLLLQYPDVGFSWGDVECKAAHPFICEVDLMT